MKSSMRSPESPQSTARKVLFWVSILLMRRVPLVRASLTYSKGAAEDAGCLSVLVGGTETAAGSTEGRPSLESSSELSSPSSGLRSFWVDPRRVKPGREVGTGGAEVDCSGVDCDISCCSSSIRLGADDECGICEMGGDDVPRSTFSNMPLHRFRPREVG